MITSRSNPAKCNTIMKIYSVRILEHDTCDNIRIGQEFVTCDLNKTAEDAVSQYDKKLSWAGGFKAACETKDYYERIAIVDANTLQTLKEIYLRKNGGE